MGHEEGEDGAQGRTYGMRMRHKEGRGDGA